MTIRHANGRTPLLLLILGAGPPVPVKGRGRIPIEQSIGEHVEAILQRVCWDEYSKQELLNMVPDVVDWITWEEVSSIIQAQLETLSEAEPSARASVVRLAHSVTDSIARHSSP